jgi:hypothetical protein
MSPFRGITIMDAVPTVIHKLKGRARKHENVVTKHGDLVSVLRLDKYAVLTSTGPADHLDT